MATRYSNPYYIPREGEDESDPFSVAARHMSAVTARPTASAGGSPIIEKAASARVDSSEPDPYDELIKRKEALRDYKRSRPLPTDKESRPRAWESALAAVATGLGTYINMGGRTKVPEAAMEAAANIPKRRHQAALSKWEAGAEPLAADIEIAEARGQATLARRNEKRQAERDAVEAKSRGAQAEKDLSEAAKNRLPPPVKPPAVHVVPPGSAAVREGDDKPFYEAPPKPDAAPRAHSVGGRLVDDTGKVIYEAPTEPKKPSVHSVGGALVDDTGKVIYSGAASPLPTAVPDNGQRFNEQYLSTLDPGLARKVKALVSGRYPVPTGAALKDPAMQQLITAAFNYEPGSDLTSWKVRGEVRSDFAKGKAGVNIRSLNTLVHHAGRLMESTKALGNSGVPIFNWTKNIVQREAGGNPKLKAWGIDAQAVESEAVSLFKGTGATNEEIAALRQHFNPNAAMVDQVAATKEVIELAFGRLSALKDQWDNAFRGVEDYAFLSPDSERIVRDRLNLNPGALIGGSAAGPPPPPNGQAAGSPGGTPPPANVWAQVPEGKTITGPDGKRWKKVGGQAVAQ